METDRKELIKRFQSECFNNANQDFQANVKKNLAFNAKKYMEQMVNYVKEFMKSVTPVITLINEQVGCIEISFLRLSAFEDKLLISLEAYDALNELGSCLADVELSLDWYQNEWTELKAGLEKERKKEQWCRWISEEDIQGMLQNSLEELIVNHIFFFKYAFEDCDKWSEFQELPRTDTFMLSIGEFHDQQKLLFVSREPVDIFLSDTSSFRYYHFDEKVYKKKPFRRADFKGAQFTGCIFTNCEFQGINFKDARFQGCRFFQCDMFDVDFTGGKLDNCIFEECNIKGVTWFRQTVLTDSTFDDVYRKTSLVNCQIIHCTYNEEQFNGCVLNNVQR